MTLPASLRTNLRIPVIASPLFILSNPALVVAQCKAGVVGSMPSLNARPQELLDEWISEIRAELDKHDRETPQRPAAPFAINLIVHKSNGRVESDLDLVVRQKVPIVITSLGVRREVNEAIHSYGGIVLHDVISLRHAEKAIENGADGLIAIAAGAGGHAGTLSPFAFVQEIRKWWAGPLALSGCLATGQAVLAAQAMGADLGYIGTAFIATREANAKEAYKQMIVEGNAESILFTNYFTGVYGNYLRRSIERAGIAPDSLPDTPGGRLNLEKGSYSEVKAWRDIWGAGQGIGAIEAVVSVEELVSRLHREYHEALRRVNALVPAA